MRIAFCGKGGSGKSTLSSLTARYLAHLNKPVLVVDGDINQHLGQALGFSEDELAQQPKLGMDTELFYTTIKGNNPRLSSLDYLTESTPAARGSGVLAFNQPSPVFDYYQRSKNGIRLLAVGSHDDEKVGATCYHSFTGAFGIFLTLKNVCLKYLASYQSPTHCLTLFKAKHKTTLASRLKLWMNGWMNIPL
jgi:CO dehydrogenase maturation factor